jgi:glycosyltransferase involved in cell wall biosynthesis
MPCYNEAKFVGESIRSLIDMEAAELCELIVVDGMSTDGSRKIIQSFIEQNLPIRVLENRNKIQTYGLNMGISRAHGQIIMRADAHCIYPHGYIKKCVDLLETTEAANVGGVMAPQGLKPVQKAIALAMQHPLGVGDARFHLGKYSGYVDTVYLGTFHKRLFDEIGPYDTNCRTNEDAELNLRILKAGKKIFLDSSIEVTYFPRETLSGLFCQYFNYGKGRCYTTLKHKKMTSWRQFAPIALVLTLISSVTISFFIPIFILAPILYIGATLFISLISWPKKKIKFNLRLLMASAFMIMHISWGLGFLIELISPRAKNVSAS